MNSTKTLARLTNSPRDAVELGYVQGRLILRVLRGAGWVSSEIVCRGDRSIVSSRI